MKINWPTIIKLGIASLIVGTILGVVGANPFEFWEDVIHSVRETLKAVFGAGIDGIKTALRYTLIGAGVVIPIWLVIKLWGMRHKVLPKRKPRVELER